MSDDTSVYSESSYESDEEEIYQYNQDRLYAFNCIKVKDLIGKYLPEVGSTSLEFYAVHQILMQHRVPTTRLRNCGILWAGIMYPLIWHIVVNSMKIRIKGVLSERRSFISI